MKNTNQHNDNKVGHDSLIGKMFHMVANFDSEQRARMLSGLVLSDQGSSEALATLTIMTELVACFIADNTNVPRAELRHAIKGAFDMAAEGFNEDANELKSFFTMQ